MNDVLTHLTDEWEFALVVRYNGGVACCLVGTIPFMKNMTWHIFNAMMAHCGDFGFNILIYAGSPSSSSYLPATLSAASALSCKLCSKCYPITMNSFN